MEEPTRTRVIATNNMAAGARRRGGHLTQLLRTIAPAVVAVIVATVISQSASAQGPFYVPFKTNNWTVTGSYSCADPARPWTSHCAWDLSAPANTTSGSQVATAAAGTAYTHTDSYFTEDNKCLSGESWGRWVEIRHADGRRTFYAHLKSFASGINGTAVSVGQVIGIMGNSGCAYGPHLHFELHDSTGRAVNPGDPRNCNLSTALWRSCPATVYAAAPAPVVIVDDTSGYFTRYGPSQYWLTYGIGYGGRMFATWNNGPCPYGASVCPYATDVNYAVWRPSIPSARNYRVCAYIPSDHAYTTSARYRIGHAAGLTTVIVNQQPLIGWVSLGVFTFNAGTGGYVRLGDWTGETFATRQIGFDAIKFVGDGGGC